MKKFIHSMLPVYFLVLAAFLGAAQLINYSVTAMVEDSAVDMGKCVIIDAGHGGVDGGATSYTGALESQLNLEVALRLNDLFHLLGVRTKMIRTEDISIYTEGSSIAAKKVSDLKERVKIVNSNSNALLISIHMNHYTDSIYHGPQVFYAATESSKEFAGTLQSSLNRAFGAGSNRQIKMADGVYLMQNIHRPGVLIECGFISNPAEAVKLGDPVYQKKMSCVIAANTSVFLANT